jgi:hypothetical protein
MQVIAILEVDDVDHWFTSTERSAFFEPRGMRATPFRNPAGDGNSVALLVEAPDMETLQSELATPRGRRSRGPRWSPRREHQDVHRRLTRGCPW